MTKELVEEFARKYNRSNNQVGFLLELLNEDLDMYHKLEENITKKMVTYCPDTMEEVNKILE